MITSECKLCGVEIIRRGNRAGVFCSIKCKAEWQRQQKPVDKEWLHQKYVIEGMSTYAIAKVVKRDPKNVWRWLTDYGIETRPGPRGNDYKEHKPYWDKDWLYNQYVTLQKSTHQIASEFGYSAPNMLYFLKKHDIPRRTILEARKLLNWSSYFVGEKNGMYGKRGPEVPNWKGGVTPERQAVYSSIEWTKAVSKTWRACDATCQRCGLKRNDIDVFHIHHIKSFAEYPELRCDVNNLVLLCVGCHNFVHSKKNINNEFVGG